LPTVTVPAFDRTRPPIKLTLLPGAIANVAPETTAVVPVPVIAPPDHVNDEDTVNDADPSRFPAVKATVGTLNGTLATKFPAVIASALTLTDAPELTFTTPPACRSVPLPVIWLPEFKAVAPPRNWRAAPAEIAKDPVSATAVAVSDPHSDSEPELTDIDPVLVTGTVKKLAAPVPDVLVSVPLFRNDPSVVCDPRVIVAVLP
jgi:hypothetical protein